MKTNGKEFTVSSETFILADHLELLLDSLGTAVESNDMASVREVLYAAHTSIPAFSVDELRALLSLRGEQERRAVDAIRRDNPWGDC